MRYDDEIRAAAEQLRPFGESWVNELGQAYFALNEDRKYLPNIVDRLKEGAKQDELDKSQQRWTNRFRYTAVGELCTEESLNILREAERQGYALDVLKDGTFTVTKNGTTFLRSNSDIQWILGGQSKNAGIPECDLPPLPDRQGPHDYKGYPYYIYPNGDVDGLTGRGWWRSSFNAFKRHIDTINANST